MRPGSAVYSATKTRCGSISEGLRQEVKPYNIRTTIISPGAVASELPDSVTEPDVAENVRKVYENAIPADSFASMVMFAMSQPDDVDVNEILFRPDEAGILKGAASRRPQALTWGQTEEETRLFGWRASPIGFSVV